MVMIKDREGKERYSIDKGVHKLLLRLKEKVKKEDQEAWVGFGGDTGSGKSLKAQHWMYSIFPGISIKEICFSKEEFINAVLDAKKGTGIIADEGISIFFSRASMTKEGRLIAELIAQIRQKNLIVFLCIPEPLTLDWTVQKKLDVFVHVWENRVKKNGRFVTLKGNAALFPELPSLPLKSLLFNYLRVKKSNPSNYKNRRPSPALYEKGNPIGKTFKKPWYPVGEKEYRKKKEGVLEKYRAKTEGEEVNKDREVSIKLMTELRKRGVSYRNIATACGKSVSTVHDTINAKESAQVRSSGASN